MLLPILWDCRCYKEAILDFLTFRACKVVQQLQVSCKVNMVSSKVATEASKDPFVLSTIARRSTTWADKGTWGNLVWSPSRQVFVVTYLRACTAGNRFSYQVGSKKNTFPRNQVWGVSNRAVSNPVPTWY